MLRKNLDKILFSIVIRLIIEISLSLPVLASAQNRSPMSREIKKDVSIVLLSSVGGAILGISTLAFYGNPQEHSGNVATGAFLGALSGFSYAFYRHQEYEISASFLPQLNSLEKKYDLAIIASF